MPGRSTDALSEGCLDLIRSGAKLVTKPEDVLEDYALENVNLKKIIFVLINWKNWCILACV